MTLDQIVLYHQRGWTARETDYRVMWGVLGDIMDGGSEDSTRQHMPEGIAGLSEFKKAHPKGKTENGAWRMTS